MSENKEENKGLLGDGNITRPVQELIDGGYDLEQIKYVFIHLIMKELRK